MTLPLEPHESIERLAGRLLREQPLLRAPRTLEARVMKELEHRAARPWWRKSFLHWPIPARAVFFAASFGFVKIALDTTMWTAANLRLVFDLFPSHWLYIGAFAVAVMYAAFFGLGAVAYRTLYK